MANFLKKTKTIPNMAVNSSGADEPAAIKVAPATSWDKLSRCKIKKKTKTKRQCKTYFDLPSHTLLKKSKNNGHTQRLSNKTCTKQPKCV